MKNKNQDVIKMMKKSVTKQNIAYTIDLTKINGDGSFPCPKCGTMISPEDESEENYKIIDTKLNNDELVELIVNCGNCRNNIKLTGFQQTIEGLTTE
jgi:predicted RNA-binding Zn-ribbon protein involved in translation (DUF1610 family)